LAKRLLTAQRQTEAAAAVPYATTSAKTPVTARRVGAPAGAQLALSVTEHRRQQVAVVHDLVDPAWRGQRERRSSSSIGGKSFKFMAHDPVTVSCQQDARNAAANPLSKVDARKPTKQTCAADDPKKTGLDRKLIALSEPHEIAVGRNRWVSTRNERRWLQSATLRRGARVPEEEMNARAAPRRGPGSSKFDEDTQRLTPPWAARRGTGKVPPGRKPSRRARLRRAPSAS